MENKNFMETVELFASEIKEHGYSLNDVVAIGYEDGDYYIEYSDGESHAVQADARLR